MKTRNPRLGSRTRVAPGQRSGGWPERSAFTLLELVASLAVLVLLSSLMIPALTSTTTNSAALQCRNNFRQLTAGWQQWSDEDRGYLLNTSVETRADLSAARPVWVTGNLDESGANRSNWDVEQDIARSPIWPLVGHSASVFRCPVDRFTVPVMGLPRLRVRSYSMSDVFGKGEWLDKTPNPSQMVWRTYARAAEIALPSRTFVFMDVHPDSINDAAFKVACTGSLPGDPPTAAQLIDYPSPLHNGGCNLSFADGRAEAHRWEGGKIRNAPVLYDSKMPLNVPADSSWVDTQWLAANTTVKR